MDKVYQPGNLFSAYREVAANQGAPGVDQITIEDFGAHLAKNVEQLEQQLRDGNYRPQAIKRVHIPKPGTNETRSLGIPTVRDRVVQNALRHVLEPILERQFAATTLRTLRGWFEYFQHSWRTTFRDLDGWTRKRLRSILRKRSGRRGCGHGLDHHRYPNAYFAAQGLFSLELAYARESQPCLK